MKYYILNDPPTIGADRIQEIVDAKYSEANLDEVAKSCKELTKSQQKQLLKLLNKFQKLFDVVEQNCVNPNYENYFTFYFATF